jgi:hypothetical protein
MPLNPVTVDGSTSSIHEHAERMLEVAGLPVAGWTEATGGGVSREGRTRMFGAGGRIRGMTNGRPVPQQLTIKMAPDTWYQYVKPALQSAAASSGIVGTDAYMKVNFVLVDQWVSLDANARSLTIRTTLRITEDKPDTPNDGNPFTKELVCDPVGLPEENYA